MRLLSLLGVALFVAACSTTPDSKGILSEKGYYDAAQKSLKYGNFETATKHLEALESHYPVGVYTEQAQLDVIYAHYKHLDYAGAVVAAERFMRLHPLNPQIDYAYYLRALANFEADKDAFLRFIPLNTAHRDLNSSRVAFDNFKELVTRFPQSSFAPDARQHMIFIRNQLAENEMHAGRYYLNRGTYISALNRARWVVENYPETPQAPEALAITVYCYQKLGMTDLADTSLTTLKANYPDFIDAKGRAKVDLGAQNEKRSWLNMATFNLIGNANQVDAPAPAPAPTTH